MNELAGTCVGQWNPYFPCTRVQTWELIIPVIIPVLRKKVCFSAVIQTSSLFLTY